jgi:hypothetical protein
VLRHLVSSVETAITEPSPMAKSEEGDGPRRDRDDDGDDSPLANV